MYHRYKDDIKLFAEIGFKVYRMSIIGQESFQMEMKSFPMKKD